MPEIREEKPTTLFESIEFILRHPWLFISPFVIVMSVVFAQLATTPLNYKTQALVSFETVGKIAKRDEQTINELTNKAVAGESLREIMKEIWPNAKEKDNPENYNSLRMWLKRAIYMRYDEKVNLLTISFSCSDSKLCYKVVQATINGLKREIRESTKRQLEAGLDFLKKQEDYYKTKLVAIDRQISDIKLQLKSKSEELTDRERILIREITGEIDLTLRDQTAVQKLAKYDEMLAGLQLQLLEDHKKKEAIEKSLENGEFLDYIPTLDIDNDVYVTQYSKYIADREFAIANFISQGYLPDHPQVRKLQNEIETFKMLKKRRIETLKQQARNIEINESARGKAEERVRAELENIEFEMDTLMGKIDLLKKKYQEASPQTLEEPEKISELAQKLKGLKEEKDINQKYYYNIRRQLEEEQLKSRVEEADAGLNLVVTEKPEVPTSPIPFQKTPKIIWGLIISLFIGTGLSYTVESLDNSVKSAAELRELLHTPILGSVDRINTAGEIRLKVFRKNVIFISLIAFALSAKFLIKLKFFQVLFSFLR